MLPAGEGLCHPDTSGGGVYFRGPRLCHNLCRPRRRVVIHHQNPNSDQIHGSAPSPLGELRDEPETRGEVKGAALAGFAFHPDAAAHDVDQLR